MHNNKLAAQFLTGLVPDDKGRYISEYFDMDHEEMEKCHGWIQWAFPIGTASAYNPLAPTVDEGLIHELYRCDMGKFTHNREQLNVMYLDCLHIQTRSNNQLKANHELFGEVVDNPENHHVKRISRVLHHNMLIGNNNWCQQLHRELTLLSMYGYFHKSSFAYWTRTVYYPYTMTLPQ